MKPFLTPDHPDAYLDHATPDEKLEVWRKYHSNNPDPLICANCKGYGGYNLQIDAAPLPAGIEDTAANRSKYCHFRQGCLQCSGWGYVKDQRDANCAHTWNRGENVGKCLTRYTCAKCQRAIVVDSSD